MRTPEEADSQGAGLADRLAGMRVFVNGLGITGPPVARLLAARGALVTAVDGRDDEANRRAAKELAGLGVPVTFTEHPALPPGTDLVITAPGFRPGSPLVAAAAAAGIPVIGDVELAWRLRPVVPPGTPRRVPGGRPPGPAPRGRPPGSAPRGVPGGRAPGPARQEWLGVTGTNGKTTTVRMLAAMLGAAGYRSIAAGNVGLPVIEAVTEPEPYPVMAVELSSFQLYWSQSLRPLAAVVLNVAAHHLDWHGDIESYAQAKSRIYAPGTVAVGNADDARSRELAAAAPGTARVVAFRLGAPGPGELGVADGVLLDRAFGDPAGVVLAGVADVRPAGPHNVADALAAAALARAYGVPPGAIAGGLAAFQPEPHRMSLVARVGGVDYVDDSKASNPHAAAAALHSYPSVVWIAGGLFRGADADIDLLVGDVAARLRGVVLLGADREVIRRSLARHAPDVPVVEAVRTDTGAMDLVVTEAARLAVPGDTVLLAPAAQSFDMFRDYPARGDAFAAAVARLAASR